jgi:hypothetical protein
MWERPQRKGKRCVTALLRKAARRESLLFAAAATGVETAMFANMLGPTAIDVAGVSALGQSSMYHEDEEARGSDRWRDELAQRLEAELTTLDCLARGYVLGAPSRRFANRSPARVGRGTVAIAVLAIVLGIAILTVLTVLGLKGASAAPPTPCLHDKAICKNF